MKAAAVLASTVLLLAACSSPSPTTGNTSSQKADCKPEVIAASIPAVPSYSPLPEGVALYLPFHVRGDRIYTTPKGVSRRLATLEILEGGAATAATTAGESLLKSGFEAVTVPAKDDGITRLAFTKPGYGRININAQTDVGDNPFHPGAMGIVKFDWPMPATATKPIQTAAN